MAVRDWPRENGRPINPALYAAYVRGLAAGVAGDSLDSCPYEDKRKPSGRLSWSRGFINAWRDGVQDAAADRDQALITLAYYRRKG